MSHSRKVLLSQYLTPVWAAEALVERHFPNLGSKDFVIEPSVGGGAFLQAIPSSVPAIGIDICPSMVELARENTKREIILGDFASVPLDVAPTTILGNPPFKTRYSRARISLCSASTTLHARQQSAWRCSKGSAILRTLRRRFSCQRAAGDRPAMGGIAFAIR